MRKKTDRNPARSPRFRPLRVEALERREMLDGVPSWYMTTPLPAMTAEETEMWDLVNRVRIDPLGEFSHFFGYDENGALVALDSRVDSAIRNWAGTDENYTVFMTELKSEWLALSAADPLAVNRVLDQTAYAHTVKMEAAGTMAHQYPGEASVVERIEKAFSDSADWSLAEGSEPSENVTCKGQNPGTSGWSVASYLAAAFLVDWGKVYPSHRENLMSGEFTEIGISMWEVSSSKKEITPWIITCDFASTTLGAGSDGAYLLGSIYNDTNNDGFYTANEGIGGVTVTIRAANGETVELNPSAGNGLTAAGGYQIYLQNGSYEVLVAGAAFGGAYSRSVTIDGANVKLDFCVQDKDNTGPTIDLDTDDASGNGAQVTFVEGGLGMLLASRAQIEDDGRLWRIDVAFDARPDGSVEKLTAIPVGNLQVSYNTLTGALTVYGNGTVEEFRQVLASLTYENDAEYCDPSARMVYVTVCDHLQQSASAAIEIDMELTRLPTISVADAEVWEGNDNGGSKVMTFDITLDFNARIDVAFRYALVNGSAVGGIDFEGAGGRVTIAAGERKAQVEVPVLGNYDADALAAKDFTFVIDRSTIVGALTGDEDIVALGTIKDDDRPYEIGEAFRWSNNGVYSFEFGEHQYLYSFTPTEDGLVQWRADGSGAMQIAAYIGRHGEGTQANTPLAVSSLNETGQVVEWYAEKGVTYMVMLTGPYSYRSPAMSLTTLVAQDGTAQLLVDHLLDADGSLSLRFGEDGLTLGEGANQRTLTALEMAQLQINALALAVERENANLLFQFLDEQVISFDATTERLTVGDLDITWDGFGSVVFGGGVRNELTLIGTAGDDSLEYASGSGTFSVNGGEKVYRFRDVARVSVVGGSGGDDVASLKDSRSGDTASFRSDGVTLSGGGCSLSLQNFSTVRCASVFGGKDKLEIAGENIDSLLLQTGYAQMTGRANEREYRYSATGLSSIAVDASGCANQVTVVGESNGSVEYWTTFGYLKAIHARTGATVIVTQAANLKIGGLTEMYAEKLNFIDTAIAYSVEELENGAITISETDGTRKLTLPIWPQSLIRNPNAATLGALLLDEDTPQNADADALAWALLSDSGSALRRAANAANADALLVAAALEELPEKDASFDDGETLTSMGESWTPDALPPTSALLGFENDLAQRRRKRGLLF